jgi:hypothetical protein
MKNTIIIGINVITMIIIVYCTDILGSTFNILLLDYDILYSVGELNPTIASTLSTK